MQCWQRLSASAIRVGETFAVILTCALLDTDSTTVLADETRLDPSVVQWPPFEILHGRHVSDRHTRDHRFVQYEYELRLVADSLFGRDVKLPAVPITYRVQTRLADGGISEGLERTYLLAPQSVRVLSLVPDDATDIRDQSAATFADLESSALRASVMVTTGGVLMALAALLGVLTMVRVAAGSRTQPSARSGPLPARAVLRRVDRELAAVRRERETTGWTPELAGRALTALRIAATYALAIPASQHEAEADVEEIAPDGALLLHTAFGGRRVLVSGSATPQNVARALAHPARTQRAGAHRNAERLVNLQNALTCLTRVRYSGDTQEEVAGIDEALASSQSLVRHLLREHVWLVTAVRSMATHSERLRRRLWSH